MLLQRQQQLGFTVFNKNMNVCVCVCVCVCLRVGPGAANGGLAAVGEGGHRRMYMHTRAKPWARAGERPGSSLDNRVSEYDR